MTWRTNLRAGGAALLAAALVLPAFVEAFERGASRGAECRCSNHACCTSRPVPAGQTSPSGAACPLARAGLECARSPRAETPGLRAGCGCHQGGDDAILAPPKAALFSPHPDGPAPPRETAHGLFAPQTPLSSLRFAPDPPPPRPALRCV